MQLDDQVFNNELFSANNHNTSFKSNGQGTFCFHIGILIFAPFLNKLFENGLQFIRQYLVAILLGCQNIEQNKELNYNSLDKLIGKSYKTLRLQRAFLKESATILNTENILKFNADLLNVNQQQDFYYDPHTKHYTGHLKILATWCSSIRLADKGLNMDYIHTSSGYPVYFNTTDNFNDLRERFSPNIESFRTLMCFDKEAILTYIIDRGIYAMDVFDDIAKSQNSHIITWEKDYKKDKWDKTLPFCNGSIIKTKNKKENVRLINYSFQEYTWDKNPCMRQIIVRIYDKKEGILIEVSIITDDKNRVAQQIIELMLNRWVQENDFKYLISHFGLNQITSYAFSDYKELRDQIEDKIYICSKHKALTKEIQKIRIRLKTALLRKHKFSEKHNNLEKKISVKEQERKTTICELVEQLDNSLKELEQERKNSTKHVSKIDELSDMDYKKLDTNAKDFMDAIKLLARNIFYLSLKSFKEKYNNYRDDHLLFRHLSKSPGLLKERRDGQLEICLMPQMEYQPKLKKIINQVLNEINNGKPEFPDGTNRKFRLVLNM